MRNAVRRSDVGKRWRSDIGSNEARASLRGDLDRDILDAAAEGLTFILDPQTTLKPADTPPGTPEPQSAPTTTPSI